MIKSVAKKGDKEDVKELKYESIITQNFTIFKNKVKNIFYKYNFDPLRYDISTIGGFLRRFSEDFDMKKGGNYNNEYYGYFVMQDDFGKEFVFNSNSFFDLLQDIFTEEDLIQVYMNCNSDIFAKNTLHFQKIFINKEKVVQRLKDDIFYSFVGFLD